MYFHSLYSGKSYYNAANHILLRNNVIQNSIHQIRMTFFGGGGGGEEGVSLISIMMIAVKCVI